MGKKIDLPKHAKPILIIASILFIFDLYWLFINNEVKIIQPMMLLEPPAVPGYCLECFILFWVKRLTVQTCKTNFGAFQGNVNLRVISKILYHYHDTLINVSVTSWSFQKIYKNVYFFIFTTLNGSFSMWYFQ